MFSDNLIEDLNLSRSSDKPSALAVIVRRESPSSGKPGDKAVITRDGEVRGWIGGGCTRGIVIKEAMEAIEQQSPRLVRIQPGMDAPDLPGVKNYKMTCMSGGTVEVYIEPIMQVSQIFIFGRSHIAKALCEIGAAAGFRIQMISNLADDGMFPSASAIHTLKDFDPETPMTRDYAVVCTQGEDDAKSLLTAVKAKPRYLAFVSSRKKANSIMMGLKREGVSHEDLVKINTPAGLDINAKTPEEVAISILAQIIKERRSENTYQQPADIDNIEQQIDEDLYINPVCKIPIQKSTAKHILDYEGEKVYFCCDGCRDSFVKDPDSYMKVGK